MTQDEPLRLTLQLDGPLVEEHRLPLSELLRVGKHLRDSLRDVAVVLANQGPSGTAGRSKKSIEDSVDLRVVGSPRAGSFILDLEAPSLDRPAQERLTNKIGPSLSERTVLTFLAGLKDLAEETEQLPEGFDRGVLRAIRPFGTALRKGLTEIALTACANGTEDRASITSEKVKVVQKLIKKPVRAQAVAEGILQMVDFGALECRIDRPPLPSVTVYFDEGSREVVHQAVRQFVRVTGEGQFEPESDQPSKIWASSIEILYESRELDPNAFWREKTITTLADEQGAKSYRVPDDFEEDPWRDDEEAAALIKAIRSIS